MSQFLEREIGDVVVRIDRDLCVGFGDCIEMEPTVFAFDEEGVARFVDESGTADRARVIEACGSCPVDALVALDTSGRPLEVGGTSS